MVANLRLTFSTALLSLTILSEPQYNVLPCIKALSSSAEINYIDEMNSVEETRTLEEFYSVDEENDANATNPVGIQVDKLGACELSSADLRVTQEDVTPCVMYNDTLNIVSSESDSNSNSTVSSTEILLLQITPAHCADHRDGVRTSVQKINNTTGFNVGYGNKTTVHFRLVSLIAGRSATDAGYGSIHQELLESALATYSVTYVVGTCSEASPYEGHIEGRIIMAQVGPNQYYEDNDNEYLFGIHVSSDDYALDTLRQISFVSPGATVAIAGRDRSTFYNSTCNAAATLANLSSVKLSLIFNERYDPQGDSNGNGMNDSSDESFSKDLARRMCSSGANVYVLCIASDTEANSMVDFWIDNGCLPSAVWSTSTTLAWGLANLNGRAQYFSGAGQWHTAFLYVDDYFPGGGVQLQQYNENLYGYTPTYDTVASYTIPNIFRAHLTKFFSDQQSPDVATYIVNNYEKLRRSLETFTGDTIYGRVSFNSWRRNIGRDPAGVQILPVSSSRRQLLHNIVPHSNLSKNSTGNTNVTNSIVEEEVNAEESVVEFTDACIAPSDAASAAFLFPVPLAEACNPGASQNASTPLSSNCFLCDKCLACEEGSFSASGDSCDVCPENSVSEGTGATQCYRYIDNMLPHSLKVLGYVVVAINWALAIGFGVWVFVHRKEPVVQLSQPFFLYLVAIGSAVSSATIIVLAVDASAEDDVESANIACVLIPWFYCIGFTLSFSALFAKSWRLGRIVNNKLMKRIRITNMDLLKSILVVLCLDALVLAVWTALDPLHWVRTTPVEFAGVSSNIVFVDSTGYCHSDYFVAFITALAIVHVSLLLGGHVLLYRVRNLNAQFQERRYLLIVLYTSLQLIVLGIPLLLAVGDEPVARFLCLGGIVFLTEFAMLCLIFIPKIHSQHRNRGKSAGEVAESLQKSSHSSSDPGVRSSNPAIEELETQIGRLLARNALLEEECKQLLERASCVTPATLDHESSNLLEPKESLSITRV